MGKLAGLVMIAAGVGTAAYVYPYIAAEPASSGSGAGVVGMADASASRPAPIVVRPIGSAVPNSASTSQTASTARPSVVGMAPAPAQQPTLPASVLATPSAPVAATAPIVPSADVPVPQLAKRAAKSDDAARVALTREIQAELKRVGCFAGDADGAWNTETRQAMKTFIDRVNATLPTEQPDHILKTLVQGHPGGACGKSCPSGQGLASDGRCLPTAILAQATKRPVASAGSRAGETRTAEAKPADVKTDSKPPMASSWETRTIAVPQPQPAPRDTVRDLATAQPIAVPPQVAAAPRGEPPAGRMSVGAPVEVVSPPAVTRAPSAPIVVRAKDRPNGAGETPAAGPTPVAPSAVAAAEPTSRPANGTSSRPAVANDEPEPRARPLRQPPTLAYRPPPPRYLQAYSPPAYASAPSRRAFGPQIFRQMERDGR